MTDILSSLLAACEAAPDDWTLLLVTADALQEDGQHWLGEAFRWCGENRKRPMLYDGLGEWTWWHERDRLENGNLDFCVLSSSMFNAAVKVGIMGKFGEANWHRFVDAMTGLGIALESLDFSQEIPADR